MVNSKKDKKKVVKKTKRRVRYSAATRFIAHFLKGLGFKIKARSLAKLIRKNCRKLSNSNIITKLTSRIRKIRKGLKKLRNIRDRASHTKRKFFKKLGKSHIVAFFQKTFRTLSTCNAVPKIVRDHIAKALKVFKKILWGRCRRSKKCRSFSHKKVSKVMNRVSALLKHSKRRRHRRHAKKHRKHSNRRSRKAKRSHHGKKRGHKRSKKHRRHFKLRRRRGGRRIRRPFNHIAKTFAKVLLRFIKHGKKAWKKWKKSLKKLAKKLKKKIRKLHKKGKKAKNQNTGETKKKEEKAVSTGPKDSMISFALLEKKATTKAPPPSPSIPNNVNNAKDDKFETIIKAKTVAAIKA